MRTWRAARSPSEKTATDARPRSRQARMIRTAISPRLAIRIFCKAAQDPSTGRGARRRQRRRGSGRYFRTRATTSTVTVRSPLGLAAREISSDWPGSSSGCARTCTTGGSLALAYSTPMRVRMLAVPLHRRPHVHVERVAEAGIAAVVRSHRCRSGDRRRSGSPASSPRAWPGASATMVTSTWMFTSWPAGWGSTAAAPEAAAAQRALAEPEVWPGAAASAASPAASAAPAGPGAPESQLAPDSRVAPVERRVQVRPGKAGRSGCRSVRRRRCRRGRERYETGSSRRHRTPEPRVEPAPATAPRAAPALARQHSPRRRTRTGSSEREGPS